MKQRNLGGTFLQNCESFDQRDWHSFSLTTNVEILERSLGLCTPVFIGRDVNGAKCVGFFSKLLYNYIVKKNAKMIRNYFRRKSERSQTGQLGN